MGGNLLKMTREQGRKIGGGEAKSHFVAKAGAVRDQDENPLPCLSKNRRDKGRAPAEVKTTKTGRATPLLVRMTNRSGRFKMRIVSHWRDRSERCALSVAYKEARQKRAYLDS